jgi:hypothetical protein
MTGWQKAIKIVFDKFYLRNTNIHYCILKEIDYNFESLLIFRGYDL